MKRSLPLEAEAICTPSAISAAILMFNLELAKKPIACLEYVVLHEMLHLLEPTHNDRFITLLNQFMPSWHFHQERLNQLPLRHELWANSQDHPH
jgi:predicted metal-dependent hydrolase